MLDEIKSAARKVNSARHLRSLLMAWHGISKAPDTPRARLVKS